jgi:TonB family protein
MNRLQKKCLVASTGFHLLLALILVVGPAFVSNKPVADDMPLLEFIPLETTDEMISGGGNPNAQSAPPPQEVRPEPVRTEPAPPPKPVEQSRPEPEPEPPKPAPKPAPDEAVDTSDTKPKKDFNLVPTVRNPAKATKQNTEAERRARQLADARKKAAQQLGKFAEAIGNNLSSGTSVELKGPGGGGVPYANFLQAVKSIYAQAWVVPDGVTDDSATAVASVTIARDGTVLSARIVQHSGNRDVDRSVQGALDRVPRAVPLPTSARESQRTVTINYNYNPKRLGT